jgi:hypothetical protein
MNLGRRRDAADAAARKAGLARTRLLLHGRRIKATWALHPVAWTLAAGAVAGTVVAALPRNALARAATLAFGAFGLVLRSPFGSLLGSAVLRAPPHALSSPER